MQRMCRVARKRLRPAPPTNTSSHRDLWRLNNRPEHEGTSVSRLAYSLCPCNPAPRCYAPFAAHLHHTEPVVGHDGLRVQHERRRRATRLLLRRGCIKFLLRSSPGLFRRRDARCVVLCVRHRVQHTRRESDREPGSTRSVASWSTGSSVGTCVVAAAPSHFAASGSPSSPHRSHLSAHGPLAQIGQLASMSAADCSDISAYHSHRADLHVGLRAVPQARASYVNSSRFPHPICIDDCVAIRERRNIAEHRRRFSSAVRRYPATEIRKLHVYEDRATQAYDHSMPMLIRCALRDDIDRRCRNCSAVDARSGLSECDCTSQVT